MTRSRRADFPLLAANPELHYLDSAATSQKPRAVLDAMRDYYEHDNANPHRGAYALSARATERYHDGARARRALPRRRATPTASSSRAARPSRSTSSPRRGDAPTCAPATRSSSPGSSTTPTSSRGSSSRSRRARRFRICRAHDATAASTSTRCASLVGPRTKVVAFNHVSNALGTINPVREIARDRAHERARSSCATARRRAPHLPRRLRRARRGLLRVQRPQDAAGRWASAGSIGRRAILEAMPPYQIGGDMIEYRRRRAHDVERAAAQVRGGHAERRRRRRTRRGVRLSRRASAWTRVLEHERALRAPRHRAARRRSRTCASTVRRRDERSGVVSFTVGDIHPHDLATILDEDGVCIRAGHHCAQPLMRRLGVPATARASFYVYNDEADVDALVGALEKAKALFGVMGRPAWNAACRGAAWRLRRLRLLSGALACGSLSGRRREAPPFGNGTPGTLSSRRPERPVGICCQGGVASVGARVSRSRHARRRACGMTGGATRVRDDRGELPSAEGSPGSRSGCLQRRSREQSRPRRESGRPTRAATGRQLATASSVLVADHREVHHLRAGEPSHLGRDDAPVTDLRIRLEAEQRHASPLLHEIRHLRELLLRLRRRELLRKICFISSGRPARAAARPSAGVPSARRCRYSAPAALEFAASAVLANPGRRELATARTSTSRSIFASRSASWNAGDGGVLVADREDRSA